MPLSLIWLGSLLVMAGVVFAAVQAIGQGRLSTARRARSGSVTLEPPPKEVAPGFRLTAVWPALALIAAGGAILVLAAAL